MIKKIHHTSHPPEFIADMRSITLLLCDNKCFALPGVHDCHPVPLHLRDFIFGWGRHQVLFWTERRPIRSRILRLRRNTGIYILLRPACWWMCVITLWLFLPTQTPKTEARRKLNMDNASVMAASSSSLMGTVDPEGFKTPIKGAASKRRTDFSSPSPKKSKPSATDRWCYLL